MKIHEKLFVVVVVVVLLLAFVCVNSFVAILTYSPCMTCKFCDG